MDGEITVASFPLEVDIVTKSAVSWLKLKVSLTFFHRKYLYQLLRYLIPGEINLHIKSSKICDHDRHIFIIFQYIEQMSYLFLYYWNSHRFPLPFLHLRVHLGISQACILKWMNINMMSSLLHWMQYGLKMDSSGH